MISQEPIVAQSNQNVVSEVGADASVNNLQSIEGAISATTRELPIKQGASYGICVKWWILWIFVYLLVF